MRRTKLWQRLLSIGVLALSLAVFGCSGDDGSNGASTGTLSGTVTNATTGTAVAGATVAVSPDIGVALTTDAAGNYSASLPIGTYTLTYAATNFTSQTATVSVLAATTTSKNVALAPTAAVILNTTTGAADPGGTATVSVSVDSMDGSTVSSIEWAAPALPAGVSIATPTAASTQVTLPSLTAFKDHYFDIVANRIVETSADDPVPSSYLQNRYMVMGINPLDLEEAGAVVLDLTVTMSNGKVYTQEVHVTGNLPFKWTYAIQNVPIGVPVLLHGPDTSTANWTITAAPAGSTAALQDATTQNPFFTPDVAGAYTVSDGVGSIDVYAGTWVGAITGQDANGRPTSSCNPACHTGAYASVAQNFDEWAQSGHAEIFTQNLNAGGHYGEGCFDCHTVGFNKDAVNGGIDDQPDYTAFLDAFFPGGHAPAASPDNWTNVLANYPDIAKHANIQCENCHGPNEGSGLHMDGTLMDSARVTISSDMCGRCHGEPARHGRFQQWQLSGHANYVLAIDEATVENRGATAGHCGRCHSGQGFLAWIDQGDLTLRIQGAAGNATVPELTALGLTVDTVHPQTCTVCHDPHNPGNTSGGPGTGEVRINNNTGMLPAGFQASGVGKGALCITCHNTRNGAHNDANPPTSFSAPHVAAQGDVLMGQNAYFVTVAQRSPHASITNACVNCHMEKTPPPADLSYQLGGTNHKFLASPDICVKCHSEIVAADIQDAVLVELEDLSTAITDAVGTVVDQHITAGDTVTVVAYDAATDLYSAAPIDVSTLNVASATMSEIHGQIGIQLNLNVPVDVTWSDTTVTTVSSFGVRLGDLMYSLGGTGAPVTVFTATDNLVRAAWNYFLIHGDASEGVHNPSFVFDVLETSMSQNLVPAVP